VILKTGNSVYEVDTEARQFRLVGRADGANGTPTIGRWQHFDFMSPAQPGERVRFSWLADEQGRSARIGYVETSPVTAVA
jgi:hypothetical protein